MDYKDLATIQVIKDVRTHPNADTLDLATVLGWQVVVKRGEFQAGDLCVFIVTDTIVPETPYFEFMRRVNFRVKPIRLRDEESAGLVLPISVIAHMSYPKTVGRDVTDDLGVKKYIKPIPPELDGVMIGGFPGFLIETDEKNLRTFPEALEELFGRPYYITRKDDGTSGTYFVKGGDFGVCGRTIQYADPGTPENPTVFPEGVEWRDNGFWRMARKYAIEENLKRLFGNRDFAIQGEVVGPGVQSNHLGLAEMEFHFFNIFDITNRIYFSKDELLRFAGESGVPMVPIVEEGAAFPHTIADLVKLADSLKYPNDAPAEGIVVRPSEPFYSRVLKKSWSGKVLNTYFELKQEQHKADKKAKRQHAKQNGTPETQSV